MSAMIQKNKCLLFVTFKYFSGAFYGEEAEWLQASFMF